MVSVARGRIYRRRDGKYFIYIPSKLAEDSMFPFRDVESVHVRISFVPGENELIVEPWVPKEKKSSRV